MTDEELKQIVSNKRSGPAERKSHVVSQFALQIMTDKARSLNIDRDDLVENILFEYGKFVDARLNSDYEAAEKIVDECEDAVSQAEKAIEELLGRYDPITSRMAAVSVVIENLHSAIWEEMSGGDPVDPDDMSQA